MIEQSHHELRQAFRALLHGTGCKFAASVFDPISVRMASDLGFEVAIQGGSVASLQVLGAPDISLLTLDEYAECQEFQLGQQGTPWRVLACLGVSWRVLWFFRRCSSMQQAPARLRVQPERQALPPHRAMQRSTRMSLDTRSSQRPTRQLLRPLK